MPWNPPRLRRRPSFDLSLPHQGVLAAARAYTDLARDDFRDDYQVVCL